MGEVKLGFMASQKIWRAYELNEFWGMVITGPPGIGKSTYALKILHELYRNYYNEVEPERVWKYVLRGRVVFSLDQLIDFLLRARSENDRVLALLWDDAGIHGHKYLFFRKYGKDTIQMLSSLLDVVRTKIAGWLITTVNYDNLVKPVRDHAGFAYARIGYWEEGKRIAYIYEKKIPIPSKKYYEKKIADIFECRLPDDIYKEYMEMRISFYREAEKRLIEYVLEIKKELEEEEEKPEALRRKFLDTFKQYIDDIYYKHISEGKLIEEDNIEKKLITLTEKNLITGIKVKDDKVYVTKDFLETLGLHNISLRGLASITGGKFTTTYIDKIAKATTAIPLDVLKDEFNNMETQSMT